MSVNVDWEGINTSYATLSRGITLEYPTRHLYLKARMTVYLKLYKRLVGYLTVHHSKVLHNYHLFLRNLHLPGLSSSACKAG